MQSNHNHFFYVQVISVSGLFKEAFFVKRKFEKHTCNGTGLKFFSVKSLNYKEAQQWHQKHVCR